MNFEDVFFYRSLKMGRNKPLKNYAKMMVIFAYGLTLDGRAFMEDINGGISINQINYLKTLKWRILDLYGELDTVLSDSELSDSIHYSPLLLEYGFSEIANIDGKRIIDIFDLHDKTDDTDINVKGVVKLWDRILNEFPGDIPNPLFPQGHLDYMEGLKTWADLCEKSGLDTEIIVKLLKDA